MSTITHNALVAAFSGLFALAGLFLVWASSAPHAGAHDWTCMSILAAGVACFAGAVECAASNIRK